jgi:hypothetical protein
MEGYSKVCVTINGCIVTQIYNSLTFILPFDIILDQNNNKNIVIIIKNNNSSMNTNTKSVHTQNWLLGVSLCVYLKKKVFSLVIVWDTYI